MRDVQRTFVQSMLDIDKYTDLWDMWQKDAEDIDKHYAKELQEILLGTKKLAT